MGFLLKAFMRSVGRRAPLPFRVTSPCGPSWQLAGFFCRCGRSFCGVRFGDWVWGVRAPLPSPLPEGRGGCSA
ncbi:hypothetical protein PCLA_02f0051 [Pseudomonas citronellolis]|nr:hypothetical protein PCLA_02f0051 [Pseudomonas citronellolis]